MTIRQATATMVLLLLFAPRVAGAGGSIGSAAIFDGSNQDIAVCSIRNVGTTPLLVVATIFDESGNPLPADKDRCTDRPILSGGQCSVTARIPTGVAFACSATARSGSIKNARGALTVGSLVVASDFERRTELR